MLQNVKLRHLTHFIALLVLAAAAAATVAAVGDLLLIAFRFLKRRNWRLGDASSRSRIT